MRSSISSDRARSFTFRTVGAYYSNVMQAVWPRLALRSYGEGANMAQKAPPITPSRVKAIHSWFFRIKVINIECVLKLLLIDLYVVKRNLKLGSLPPKFIRFKRLNSVDPN